MLYDPIQGEGHGGVKVAKIADFKVRILRQYYACDQKSNCEFRFLVFVLVRRNVTLKVTVHEESTGSPVWDLFMLIL